ncbi:VanW family protein [Peptoniphilus indolicus]|uniref:VanW family protein n=2 Tax=Peptoniphilus indolicus TaxID=33030 RepID=G4D546_9FIRM|nr:VanW family protein [Peptoniphilus indolicus]EGY79347.1 VanW family protein [Peptoniphilus indolicus ATCC 29427]SUB76320.1 Uncharacterized vancomycin resistance protein [Peptoniphilus indolicus]
MGNKISEKMKDKRVVAAMCVGVIFLISLLYYGNVSKSTNIYGGVRVGDIDLSKLSKQEAYEKLSKQKTEDLKNKNMSFLLEDKTIEIPYEQLGYNADIKTAVERAYDVGRTGNVFIDYINIVTPFYQKNITLNEGFEVSSLDKSLAYLTDKVFKEPVNADVVTTKEKEFKVLKSETGRYLDVNTTRDSILSNISKNEVIPLKVNISYPKVTEEKFEGIDAILSEFTTDYSTSAAGRKANVAIGAQFFNGLVVEPSQNISFNGTVGEISVKNGFQKAGVLVNGELEQGVGGGICQVSTTLYNALLLSNLQIDERHNHTRPIAYVDIGTDAAVVEGYKDLKFTNNLPHRIYLKSEADGKKLTFQVFGNKADKIYDVEIFTKLLGVESPKTVKKFTYKLYENEEEVESSGAKGYSYATYKKLKKGETETTEKISNSYYLPKDKVILVGTKEKDSAKEMVASKEKSKNKKTVEN